MRIFLVLELKERGLLEHTMALARVVLGHVALPTTLRKEPAALGLRPKVPYRREKVGCIKVIEELYGRGNGSLGVKFLNGDRGWRPPMAPQWPSN